jgi:hypothetical protein
MSVMFYCYSLAVQFTSNGSAEFILHVYVGAIVCQNAWVVVVMVMCFDIVLYWNLCFSLSYSALFSFS